MEPHAILKWLLANDISKSLAGVLRSMDFGESPQSLFTASSVPLLSVVSQDISMPSSIYRPLDMWIERLLNGDYYSLALEEQSLSGTAAQL